MGWILLLELIYFLVMLHKLVSLPSSVLCSLIEILVTIISLLLKLYIFFFIPFVFEIISCVFYNNVTASTVNGFRNYFTF